VSESHGLNPTAASLLGFLHDGDLTGYALVQTAEERLGRFWSLTRSQVYRELVALAGRGLVEAGEEGPRASRPYRLTSAGRAAFADWIDRLPGEEQIRYPLLLTVAFGDHVAPRRLVEMVEAHRKAHEDRLSDYLAAAEEHRDTLGPFERVTLDFGIRYEQAVLAWMAALPGVLPGDGEASTAAASAADVRE